MNDSQKSDKENQNTVETSAREYGFHCSIPSIHGHKAREASSPPKQAKEKRELLSFHFNSISRIFFLRYAWTLLV